MLDYDFMQNAFAAAGVVAVVSGAVGYFLVLRGQTFAGHALSHVGFTGATGAVLVGLSPIWGMVGFTLAAAVGMCDGGEGPEVAGRAMGPGRLQGAGDREVGGVGERVEAGPEHGGGGER